MDVSKILNHFQALNQKALTAELLKACGQKDSDLKSVELLITLGADVNAANDDDFTSLMLAVENNHTAIAYRLLCAMTPEERQEAAESDFETFNFIEEFYQALMENVNKIRVLIGTNWKVNSECKFSIFPIEVIEKILKLEADVALESLPDWYKNRLEGDLNLILESIGEEDKENTKPKNYISTPVLFLKNKHSQMYEKKILEEMNKENLNFDTQKTERLKLHRL